MTDATTVSTTTPPPPVRLRATPQVIALATETTVTIRLPDGGDVRLGQACRIRVFSRVNRTEDTTLELPASEAGEVRVPVRFTSAGEGRIDLLPREGDQPAGSAAVFAVGPELASLRPFRGDLHMHTTGSDGQADAIAMARAARAAGNDFIAITDHDNHEPSLRAAAEAAAEGLDLLILPGEEVTVREIGGHILSLCASSGVGRLRHRPESDAERAEVARELAGRRLVHPMTIEQYVHAVWTIRTIRRLGGMALIAHPFWVGTSAKYYPPRCLIEQLLADELCDGLELLNGSPLVEGNRLAIACWCDQALRGRRWPVIGGSDAHTEADLANTYWTIAFAPALDGPSIMGAIAGHRTVACDLKVGPNVTIYGPLPLVEYAYFLHREYFPRHDRLCRDGRSRREIDRLASEFWAADLQS